MNAPAALPPAEAPAGKTTAGKSFLRALARTFLILVLCVLLSVAFFYLVPEVYNRLVVPIDENRFQLVSFKSEQEQAHDQLSDDLDSLSSRLSTAESLNANYLEMIAGLEDRVGLLETGQQSLDEDLAAAVEQSSSRLDEIDSVLKNLGSTQSASQAMLTALSTAAASKDDRLDAFQRDLYYLKAMELVTRSRLFLAQNNPGLAEVDIRTARDLLMGLDVLPFQKEALQQVIARLNQVLDDLPGSLVIADHDLETAWQLLVLGMPASPGSTPLPDLEVTATITATLTVTNTAGTPYP